uniref:Uncharacterized protein n=1 Tax=Arundo donax TaxID=35708 RepID=A0A0A8ZLF6_ARUDO
MSSYKSLSSIDFNARSGLSFSLFFISSIFSPHWSFIGFPSFLV